jgi:hypothetical protein
MQPGGIGAGLSLLMYTYCISKYMDPMSVTEKVSCINQLSVEIWKLVYGPSNLRYTLQIKEPCVSDFLQNNVRLDGYYFTQTPIIVFPIQIAPVKFRVAVNPDLT